LNGSRSKLKRLWPTRRWARSWSSIGSASRGFGVEYVEAGFASPGTAAGRGVEEREVDDDLVQDITEVLTSMCARRYGRRSARRRAERAVQAASEAA